MDDYAEVRSVKVLHELGLTEDMVRDHVIRPERVNAAALRIELRDAGDGDDDPSNPPLSGLFYSLNVQKLSRDLHDVLSGCVVGYPYPASVPGWSSGRPFDDERLCWLASFGRRSPHCDGGFSQAWHHRRHDKSTNHARQTVRPRREEGYTTWPYLRQGWLLKQQWTRR